MLYRLLNDVCDKINKIDVKSELPIFVKQLNKMRPNLRKELLQRGIEEDKLDATVTIMSLIQLGLIKNIPKLVAEFTEIVKKRSHEPAFRCVVAGSLAYLVQPNDLLPDNLPGGYGFIDDLLMLQEACALSWDVIGDTKKAEERRKIFQFIFQLIPEGQEAIFAQAIKGMAFTMNVFRYLAPMDAEMTIQVMIENPLQVSSMEGKTSSVRPLSPIGQYFTKGGYQERPRYTWQDGGTIGINFPGGGSVVADASGVYAF